MLAIIYPQSHNLPFNANGSAISQTIQQRTVDVNVELGRILLHGSTDAMGVISSSTPLNNSLRENPVITLLLGDTLDFTMGLSEYTKFGFSDDERASEISQSSSVYSVINGSSYPYTIRFTPSTVGTYAYGYIPLAIDHETANGIIKVIRAPTQFLLEVDQFVTEFPRYNHG